MDNYAAFLHIETIKKRLLYEQRTIIMITYYTPVHLNNIPDYIKKNGFIDTYCTPCNFMSTMFKVPFSIHTRMKSKEVGRLPTFCIFKAIEATTYYKIQMDLRV